MMSAPFKTKPVLFSEKLYERVLAAYPQAHREEYGQCMLQLFRDQCRDAWDESHFWVLMRLWLRIIPDLLAG